MNADHEAAKLESALAAMKPMLQAASDAAHQLTTDDEEENTDRLIDLGMLVEMASHLCPAQLHLLVGVVFALVDLNHDGKEERPNLHA